ncbi:hypothetical protein CLV59_10164 [Chitinophaga dinghuensis]|uniref:Amidohydrolase 3 domain-containing protein n=1 Tax=Chitinophaga dinghuensis TaxID=1539050 RepID=A0A327W9N9_9BACT|nr:amidohydrolase [Chitinophaga dinghuensis]RAJ87315.1 hypothetical protein CLV59_10164 [Chitinophaga dinghuensis]
MKKNFLQLFCLISALVLCTPAIGQSKKNSTTFTMYLSAPVFSKRILTMRGKNVNDLYNYVDALVEQNGIIKFIGTADSAKMFVNKNATHGEEVKMEFITAGTILMPGFIDPHAHIAQQVSAYATIDLAPLPYGNVNTMTQLYSTMRNAAKLVSNPTGLVVGNGYDDSRLTPMQHPRRDSLDNLSGNHPMYLIHNSGHMGVGNTALLKALGFMDPNASVEGGTIVRENGQPTGLLTENANVAAMEYILKHTNANKDSTVARLMRAEKLWFANGLTTVCEGRCDPNSLLLIEGLNMNNQLTADFIVLPDFDTNKDNLSHWKQYYNNYNYGSHHFKIGGVKFTFDGSPQGRDAWLKVAYAHPPIWEKPGYRGAPIYPDPVKLREYVKGVFDMGMSVHIHCNGDAAIEEGLSVIENLKNHKAPLKNVIIHSQMCTTDQILRFKNDTSFLMPSFFPTHTYLWGVWHRDTTMGLTRARRISPCKDALDNNILFTIHTDAPVTPPDMLTAAYSAVNRITLMDKTVLGPEQRIDGYNALKAMTVNAAIQWGELSSKGTLDKGKKADMILISGDPMQIDPSVTVVSRTYKDGNEVYRR